mmetsp:Transcript_28066/g.77530  ORF Transcript_28066/g.77530 Transcript_28066/m.77530 type:complete len:83 (-) Transcript_28066:133-381(-)
MCRAQVDTSSVPLCFWNHGGTMAVECVCGDGLFRVLIDEDVIAKYAKTFLETTPLICGIVALAAVVATSGDGFSNSVCKKER